LDRLLEATFRAEQHHFWWQGFRAFVRPVIAEVSRKPVRALDCGCGTGANLAMLREFGRVIGIDLTWSGLEFAHTRGERGIAQAAAEALPFADAAFDLVTSFDMLQCVPDAAEPSAFNEITRVLQPGGHAVLNVAAMNILWGNHSILAREVRRYSKRQLRDRLERAGLEPVRITYTNATLFPILAPLRIMQRAMGLATSDTDAKAAQEVTIPPGPINSALSALLRVEARAVRAIDMPFGSSLMAVARRP
jgi:ubiquinone/menaquinone biosynthesis C-methylase UbiE